MATAGGGVKRPGAPGLAADPPQRKRPAADMDDDMLMDEEFELDMLEELEPEDLGQEVGLAGSCPSWGRRLAGRLEQQAISLRQRSLMDGSLHLPPLCRWMQATLGRRGRTGSGRRRLESTRQQTGWVRGL